MIDKHTPAINLVFYITHSIGYCMMAAWSLESAVKFLEISPENSFPKQKLVNLLHHVMMMFMLVYNERFPKKKKIILSKDFYMLLFLIYNTFFCQHGNSMWLSPLVLSWNNNIQTQVLEIRQKAIVLIWHVQDALCCNIHPNFLLFFFFFYSDCMQYEG